MDRMEPAAPPPIKLTTAQVEELLLKLAGLVPAEIYQVRPQLRHHAGAVAL
jgi:hypothetical protein